VGEEAGQTAKNRSMTLSHTIIDAVDRFGDRCAEQLQTGAKLAERDRLLEVIEQHMASTPSSKPEWATLDPRWLLQYLHTNTTFNVDAASEMIEFAQAAARRACVAALRAQVQTGPWCCEKAKAQDVVVCQECADISRAYSAAMGVKEEP